MSILNMPNTWRQMVECIEEHGCAYAQTSYKAQDAGTVSTAHTPCPSNKAEQKSTRAQGCPFTSLFEQWLKSAYGDL